MKRRLRGITALLMALVTSSAPALGADAKKKEEALATINKHRAELIKMSDQIWSFAETALRETRSARVLADYAEAQGFKVERGVAGMPTGDRGARRIRRLAGALAKGLRD
jgi:aminobenzoyl-glutamate utilization protein B